MECAPDGSVSHAHASATHAHTVRAADLHERLCPRGDDVCVALLRSERDELCGLRRATPLLERRATSLGGVLAGADVERRE